MTDSNKIIQSTAAIFDQLDVDSCMSIKTVVEMVSAEVQLPSSVVKPMVQKYAKTRADLKGKRGRNGGLVKIDMAKMPVNSTNSETDPDENVVENDG